MVAQQNDTYEYFKQQAQEYRQKFLALTADHLQAAQVHKSEMRDMQAKMEETQQKRIDRLEQVNQKQLHSFELFMQEKEDEVRRLQEENQDLQQSLSKAENELHVARQQLRELKDSNEELTKQVDALKKESDEHVKNLHAETHNKLGLQAADQQTQMDQFT